MSDDVLTPAAKAPAAAEDGVSGRSGRTPILAFVTDPESEASLRLGLLSAGSEEIVVHRGGGRHAISAMKKLSTPRVLLVDISKDEQPLSTLTSLSEVVEPDVRVLVIGERHDVNLYRMLTRNLGVAEYLYKPLSAEVVAQHFGPYVAPAGVVAAQTQGGRILAITSVCGGAGATTLAANLGWYLANEVKRHTVLLDANLHTGTIALLLGAKTGSGLRLALETPSRVDDLFMERIAEPAGDRLAVIAAEEKLTEQPTIVPGAARHLLQKLRQRYNYVILDVPLAPSPWHGELLEITRQRVLVMEPTLQAVRDTLRAMAVPMGPQQIRQSLIVLNNVGAPGKMTRQQIEDALQHKVDVAIPHLPRVVNPAATMGTPAAVSHSGFKLAMRDLARGVAAISPSEGSYGTLGRFLKHRIGR